MKYTLLRMMMVASLTLQGCSLYRKPEVPSPQAPQKFKYARHQVISAYKKPIKAEWWRNFGDDKLNALVERALKNNYNYQMSVKNIDIARTYVTQNVSLLWPQLDLNANASRNHSMNIFNIPTSSNGINGSNAGLPGLGRIYNLAQLYATVSYEIDVWNQIGNTVNQSRVDMAASYASSLVVRLTLINSVIDSYFQIATLNTNIANLHEQERAQQQILRLTKIQFSSGLIDASGVDDAKNQLEVIRENLSSLRKEKQITQAALAYILGEYPENISEYPASSLSSLKFKQLIPASLPSQMLTERPDIQQAYYQVLSTGYIEKQNYANFFPAFNMTGMYGYASQTLSTFVTGNNKFWNYGLGIMQPVFNYQLISSQYARAKIQYENSILNYKNVILNAFKEVDSALSSYQQDTMALVSYQHQYLNNKNKLALARSQYRSGLTNNANYLTTKLAFLQSRYYVNSQQLLVTKDILQVYKALGLGAELVHAQ